MNQPPANGQLRISGARTAQRHEEKQRTISALGLALFFVLGMGMMAALQNLTLSSQANGVATGRAVAEALHQSQISHTPGGDLEYIRLPLEEPKGFLPDTSPPLQAPTWFFENYTTAALRNLIQACDLTASQRESLLDSSLWKQDTNGIAITPPPAIVLEMSRTARAKIYSILALSEANSSQQNAFRFRPESFEHWLNHMNFASESQLLLRKLSYEQRGAVCFCDAAIAQRLLSPVEFQQVVHSLYGEQTFIMRLIITPQSDINGIIRYWRKGGRAEAIRPLLESMARVRGGAALNISYLLSPFAETRLYTYADRSQGSEAMKQNCFWTAMNFFNEKPDPQFFSVEHARCVLAEKYRAILREPIYGDLAVFEDDSGKLIHMCVYLADDVVFTKNGADYMQPWVLMKIPDVLAYYNARERPRLKFYRSITD